VTLDGDGPGGEPKRTRTVTCAEDGPEACDPLSRLPASATEPLDPNVACTEIYGGPDVATVEGALEGQEISLRLTRANGCEIARFDEWLPVFRALFVNYRPGSAIGA
jgi:hypothetical protein